jgi:hypothetical protein
MPAVHEGGTPSLRAATAKITAETGVLRTAKRKTGTGILPRLCFSRQAPVTAFRAIETTAKNAGKMPAIHEGKMPSLRATTAGACHGFSRDRNSRQWQEQAYPTA